MIEDSSKNYLMGQLYVSESRWWSPVVVYAHVEASLSEIDENVQWTKQLQPLLLSVSSIISYILLLPILLPVC